MGTHLKNFTLLFLSQAVVFNAYNLLICESLLQRRWQKQTCIRPVLLAPVPFRGDTEGMINNIQANSKGETIYWSLSAVLDQDRIRNYNHKQG